MVTRSVLATPAATSRKVVIAAALGRELQPLKRGRHRDLLLVETGEGRTNASREICRALDTQPRAVVGIGFAGALSSSLEIGDVIIATRIEGLGAFSEGLHTRVLSLGLERVYGGAVVTVDDVVCTAAEKHELSGRLIGNELGVVDMESSAVAVACLERGVQFVIARVVSDLFSEDLPVDFNRCRRADGRLSTLKVTARAIERPGSLRGLWELRRRTVHCAARLAEIVTGVAPLVV
ncbi:MAG TPA: hypothetical protein VKM94_14365 [Blastocatellia bacterium]|nr:hypothetical protein [Blastocatellia bacterium]